MSTQGQIDPKTDGLTIQRVNNGWLIQRHMHNRRDEFSDMAYVARTPKELADLLQEWATRQQDIVKDGT